MPADTTNREPDYIATESKNVAWSLLPRRQSSDCNMTIGVQRFEPGGSFEAHSHDLEQFFYVTAGALEMTVEAQTSVFSEGDFVHVPRNAVHSGRNVTEGDSVIVMVDYWPADSDDRIGLD